MWETQVRSLGWEDPLEKEMATHCSSLAWKIPWTEKPGRLQSMGSQRVWLYWATSLSLGRMHGTVGYTGFCIVYWVLYTIQTLAVKRPSVGLNCKIDGDFKSCFIQMQKRRNRKISIFRLLPRWSLVQKPLLVSPGRVIITPCSGFPSNFFQVTVL